MYALIFADTHLLVARCEESTYALMCAAALSKDVGRPVVIVGPTFTSVVARYENGIAVPMAGAISVDIASLTGIDERTSSVGDFLCGRAGKVRACS